MSLAPFEVKPFPRERHDVVDALEVGARRHMVHALLELDVTLARQLIRERAHRGRGGTAGRRSVRRLQACPAWFDRSPE